jgi:hypothetical protein
MYTLTTDGLKTLASRSEGFSISLFLPLQRGGPDALNNPVRLKSLFRQALKQVREGELPAQEAQAWFAKAERQLDHSLFWERPDEGLAVFLAEDMVRCCGLPIAPSEGSFVGRRFMLLPLLEVFHDNHPFYILALSQNDVRLFKANRFSEEELTLENTPLSLAQALAYDTPERQLQFRTSGAPGGGARIYGNMPDRVDTHENLLHFFRQVNHGVHHLLREERSPLVLAAAEYLFSIYREANTYPYLEAEGVPGSPDRLSPRTLRESAWRVVQPRFQAARKQALEEYWQRNHQGGSSHFLQEVIPAARYGRVASLFVAPNHPVYGRFEEETGRIHLVEQPGAEDEELINYAVGQTLLHGGDVYTLAPEETPEGVVVMAVFRY